MTQNLCRILTILMLALPLARGLADDSLIHHIEFVAEGKTDPQPQMLGDRFAYWNDDPLARFYLLLTDKPAADATLRLQLTRGDEVVAARSVDAPTSRKVFFQLTTAELPVGDYRMTASLGGADTALSYDFSRQDRSRQTPDWPADGLPIIAETQAIMPNGTWPMRATVPVPQGLLTTAENLQLTQDGKPHPASIRIASTWLDGSVSWMHLDFVGAWRDGQAADYRLLRASRKPTAKSALSVKETADLITVDTGRIRFDVKRTEFDGIHRAWMDPSGRGQYETGSPVLLGGGPYLVDSRLIRFSAAAARDVEVRVEERGDASVTILAEGWYESGAPANLQLCRFVTRMTAYAGQPMVQVQHRTIITYDTRLYRLADVGFEFKTVGNESYWYGVDDAVISGDFGEAGRSAFLHQDRSDRVRVVQGEGPIASGRRADGWAAVGKKAAATDAGMDALLGGEEAAPSFAPRVAVLLRDIWQKFPKELGVSDDSLSVHFWPRHGHRAFDIATETAKENIYKYWCFHQGGMLDLNLPNDYFDALSQWPSAECHPENAMNGNGQGLVISNEFALLLTGVSSNALSLDGDQTDFGAQARLWQRQPAAMTSAEWNAGSQVEGRMAAADFENFGALETALEQGYLSYMRSMDRGNAYGMWNYWDIHTYWNLQTNSAELHRPWLNGHYHHTGGSWLLYLRSGSPDLLRFARAATDHYMNVDTVNYVSTNDAGRPEIPFLKLGGMYHCKAPTHWGNEAPGMEITNSHLGLWGHWVDPDAARLAWLAGGDPRARDSYRTWADAVRAHGLPSHGTRREINTTLAYVISLYETIHDPGLLPAIHGMGRSLRSTPLADQFPGPMWHPLWINRYYDLTRDPNYPAFIADHAGQPTYGNTWAVALHALAYDLAPTDTSVLEQNFSRLSAFPMGFHRADGSPYDWFGAGPGPLGMSWLEMGWPYLLHALKAAGYADDSAFQSSLPMVYPSKASVLALDADDQAFTLVSAADAPVFNRFEATRTVRNADGNIIDRSELVPRKFPELKVASDGFSGLYQIDYQTGGFFFSRRVTTLPFEAAVLQSGKYQLRHTEALLATSQADKPVSLSFRALDNGRSPFNWRIYDANGALASEGSLLYAVAPHSDTITLDPAANPMPWRIVALGLADMQLDTDTPVYWGTTPEDIQRVIEAAAK